jgi:hypothetical protein
MNKETAFVEFCMNLIEQGFFSEMQMVRLAEDFNWVFWNFEMFFYYCELK